MRIANFNKMLLVFAILSMCSIDIAKGASRASKEQIEDMKQMTPLDNLLKSPAKNVRRIKSLFFNLGNENIPESLCKVENALSKCTSKEDIIALHILQASGSMIMDLEQKVPRRNGAAENRISAAVLQEVFGNEEDSQKSQNEYNKQLEQLLEDYETLSTAPNEQKLRKLLTDTINDMLATSKSRALPETLKQLAIIKYVSNAGELLSHCPLPKAATIFRNLEAESELSKCCAVAEQDTVNIIQWKMQMAAVAGLTSVAIANAEALLARLDIGTSPMEYDAFIASIMETYAKFSPEETLTKFEKDCARRPELLLMLYKASCNINQFNDKAKRWQHWLEPCVVKIQENTTKNKNGLNWDDENTRNILVKTYHALMFDLMAGQDYEGAVYLANSVMSIKELEGDEKLLGIAKLVVKCNKALGRQKVKQ